MGCLSSSLVRVDIASNTTGKNSLKHTNNNMQQSVETRFIENSVLIWLTNQISIAEKSIADEFRHVISSVRILADENTCLAFINKIHNEKVFLVVTFGHEQIIKHVANLPQIYRMYIFNPTSQVIFDSALSRSIQGNIFCATAQLCSQLRSDRKLCEFDCITITTAITNVADEYSVKRTSAFLFTQFTKEVISRYKFENDSKNRLVEFCREHYADNDEVLHTISDFEATYRPQKALSWLTKSNFISHIISRTLRTMEIDILYKLCFIIKHIHLQLTNIYENFDSLSKTTLLTAYRGKTMSSDEFNLLLRNSVGGFLSASGFLLAKTSKNAAMDLLHDLNNTCPGRIPILFEFHIDTTLHTTSPFALLHQSDREVNSDFDEICFTMSSVFRIESVETVDDSSTSMWIAKLLLVDNSDATLFRLLEPTRSTEAHANPIAYIGKLSIDMGDFDRAEKFYLLVLVDKSIQNQPRRSARVNSGLAAIYKLKNDFSRALEYYQKALDSNLTFLAPDHPDLIPFYRAIGECYSKTGNYVLALTNYERAAQLMQQNAHATTQQAIELLNNEINNMRAVVQSSNS